MPSRSPPAPEELSRKSFALLLCLYGAAAFCLFLLFYPVLSGFPKALMPSRSPPAPEEPVTMRE